MTRALWIGLELLVSIYLLALCDLSFAQGPGSCVARIDLSNKSKLFIKELIKENRSPFNDSYMSPEQIWALDKVINQGSRELQTLSFYKNTLIDLKEKGLIISDQSQLDEASKLLSRDLTIEEKAAIGIARIIGRGEQSKFGIENPMVYLGKSNDYYHTYTLPQIRRKVRAIKGVGFTSHEISLLFGSVILGDQILNDKSLNFVLQSDTKDHSFFMLDLRQKTKSPVEKQKIMDLREIWTSIDSILKYAEKKEDEFNSESLQSLATHIKASRKRNSKVLKALENYKPIATKGHRLPNEKEINEIFWTVTQHPVARLGQFWKYDPDLVKGMCFGRATAVHMESYIRNIEPKAIKKIWVSGALSGGPSRIVKFPFEFNGKKELEIKTDWQFHVATILMDNLGTWWVIDPFQGRPLKLYKWFENVSRLDLIGNIRLTVTDPSRFSGTFRYDYDVKELIPVIQIKEEIKEINSLMPEIFVNPWYNDYFVDLAKGYSIRAYKIFLEGQNKIKDAKRIQIPLPQKSVLQKAIDYILRIMSIGL